MSSRSQSRLTLEREYYNRIYRNNASQRSRASREDSYNANQHLLGINQPHSYASVSTSSNASLFNDVFFPHLNSIINMDQFTIENSSVRFIDDSEAMSFAFNLRRLGIESASISSLMNLRTNSYLKSRDEDCIETLLIQMESADKKEPAKETIPPPPPPPTPPAKAAETTAAPVELSTETVQKENIFRRVFLRNKCCSAILDLKNNCNNYFKPIESQSNFYLAWLGLIAIAYVYNVISISIRYSFEYDALNDNESLVSVDLECFENFSANFSATNHSVNSTVGCKRRISVSSAFIWMITDYVCDVLYLIDIFLVQTRIKFLSEGLWQLDIKLTALNYFKSWTFVFDVVSVLPTDLLQFFVGLYALTRINRWLKLKSLWEFYDRWDRFVESFVFIVRLLRLFTYLLIVIHLYACAYYTMSMWESKFLNVKNAWVYNPGETRIHNYMYAFLFGLKTASTIGNNPPPFTKYEYLFTAIAYLLALFLFALIVGQIRNIIGSLSTKQDAFLIVLDTTVKYLKALGLPENLMFKVSVWFEYFSKVQDAIPFEAISFLPINLQTDLAIEVYYELLSKVKLFQECEKNLLYALVLKLEPIIFMPGDYICKKGDVGREMFIVDKGIVEVVVDGRAVAQMKEGSYFGEISLLSMGDGGNRRTANVMSKGFSKLLVLHKSDLNEVLKSYPGMEEILRKAADSYLKKK